ncbi:hypothetical protein PPACK8108_LOCUS7371 [Phakopsora pachyrhizi]|uniref:Secreted protein n=1 Tax=Phakopsora pachyrhizi TaxID=170000 RepID=A0AAV0ASS6_PHAPC|nr:hypothetical protein PPACK8108_LOCUS7371 [Phakopsora pachyrhizi]
MFKYNILANLSTILLSLIVFQPFRPTSSLMISEPNSNIATNVCNSFSCGVFVDQASWMDKDYGCSDGKNISSASIGSASISFFSSRSSSLVNQSEWPESCALSANETCHSYNNGEWTMYYSISTICQCPDGKYPACSGATQLSDSACNMSM